jgi:allantoicase
MKRRELDLAAVESGGRVVASSDQFFSEPLSLLMPGRGKDMGDGWETRRRRGPGHDWVIVKLGVPGNIRRVEVDTAHFKGNFPRAVRSKPATSVKEKTKTPDWNPPSGRNSCREHCSAPTDSIFFATCSKSAPFRTSDSIFILTEA